MPKLKTKLAIKLNLLKPQSNPEKLPVKLFQWLLSSGRYIFVLVNALVLIAFVARFKLDADLASKKEAIKDKIPYIESLKSYEILIRETQLKLSTIDSVKKSSLDWPAILKKIADQTPGSVQITSINMEKDVDTATVHITGQTQVGSEVTSFIAGLKGENTFSGVTLVGIGLEQGIIKFTINASAKSAGTGEKSI